MLNLNSSSSFFLFILSVFISFGISEVEDSLSSSSIISIFWSIFIVFSLYLLSFLLFLIVFFLYLCLVLTFISFRTESNISSIVFLVTSSIFLFSQLYIFDCSKFKSKISSALLFSIFSSLSSSSIIFNSLFSELFTCNISFLIFGSFDLSIFKFIIFLTIFLANSSNSSSSPFSLSVIFSPFLFSKFFFSLSSIL